MPRITPDDVINAEGATRQKAICAMIRKGAYPHVAAQAVGVDRATFDRWMSTLTTKRGSRSHRKFAKAVTEAQAFARVTAEMAVFTDAPRQWLKEGPGKERADDPGWSTPAVPISTSTTQVNVLASPEWNGLWGVILGALANFPEARLALVEALGEHQAAPQPTLTIQPERPRRTRKLESLEPPPEPRDVP
jgi:transposase-like protein